MSYEVNGKTVEADDNGYLVELSDWSEELASVIAKGEEIELGEKHWDVVNYLREEYYDNAGHQPNMRQMMKEMDKRWGSKDAKKVLYELFPMGPAKQAGKIAGLPETKTKGGY